MYTLTLLTGTDTEPIDNVTKALGEMVSVDTDTIQGRDSTAAFPDKFKVAIPNHKARRAGEVVKFRVMLDWLGAANTAVCPARLKITFHGNT